MKKRIHQRRLKAWPIQGQAQRGVALFVALIILLLLSILSVTGANQTLLGEKMASNQYTQTKAFLAADTGISEALQAANAPKVAQAVADGSPDAIKDAWDKFWESQGLSLTGPNPLDVGAAFSMAPVSGGTYWNPTDNEFEVEAKGSLSASGGSGASVSTRTLIAHISAATLSTPNTPFVSAVVGQQGVTMTGGSGIDIYNSSYGAYGSQVTVDGNTFKNSSIDSPQLSGLTARTCTTDGLITLSGKSPLYGDVIGTGGLRASGATPVYGNIHVNGDADFNGRVYGNLTAGGRVTLGSASIVQGYVLSGGNLAANSEVDGAINVYGSANFSNSSKVPGGTTTASGDVTVGSSFQKQQAVINAGGSINHPSYFSSSATANYHPNLPPDQISLPTITPVTNDQSDCSTFHTNDNLGQMFSTVRDDSQTQLLSDWLANNQCADGSCYSKNGSNITLHDVNGSHNLTIGQSGQKTLLKAVGNVSPDGTVGNLYIKGSVTLLVDGNFNSGDRTTIHIGSSDSLKLLVTGSTTFSRGSKLDVEGPFVRTDSNGQATPAVAVYSNYDSSSGGYGVTVAGSNSSYVAVYAPKSTVNITGSGDIYGSVVAQKIQQSGNAAIHYDQALQKVAVGQGSGSSTPAQLKSWQQVQGQGG